MSSHQTLESLFSPLYPPAQAGPSSMLRSVSQDHSYTYEEDDSLDAEAEENVFRDMTFDEVLEDLNARFLVNLPKEETTLVRIYWQAEQAHWFYEDYLRPLNPHLPSLGQRHFTQLIISSSPIYASLAGPDGIDYDGVWGEYISYKSMVPCCGGILLNQDGDKVAKLTRQCLMVRGWKSSAGWCFPRGKININEPEDECAIREVFEETGFDLTGRFDPSDQIQTQVNAQIVTMFIVPGVDEGTIFETQTRKEIGAIEWVKLTDLPTWTGKRPKKNVSKGKKFYNVTPFVGPLKKWMSSRGYNPNAPSNKKKQPPTQPHLHQAPTQPNQRNLQPFYEPSAHIPPAPPTSTLPHNRGASALDSLFDRFITKQEEDLSASAAPHMGGAVRVTGASEQKEGMDRLFGGMNVLESERQAGAEIGDSGTSEEDELARLLGGVAVVPKAATINPSIKASSQPHSEKANRLLSLLTARTDTAIKGNEPAVSLVPGPNLASVVTPTIPMPVPTLPPTAAIDQPRAQPEPAKTHHASLLSLLSPHHPAPSLAAVPLADAGAPPQTVHAHTTSSGADPAYAPEQDQARREKQRKLLEMTLAGIGLDPTPSAAAAGPAPVGPYTTGAQAGPVGYTAQQGHPGRDEVTASSPSAPAGTLSGSGGGVPAFHAHSTEQPSWISDTYGHPLPTTSHQQTLAAGGTAPVRPVRSSPTKPPSAHSNSSPSRTRPAWTTPIVPADHYKTAPPAPPPVPLPAGTHSHGPLSTARYPQQPPVQGLHQQHRLLEALAARPQQQQQQQPFGLTAPILGLPQGLPNGHVQGGQVRPGAPLPFAPGQPLGPARPQGYVGGVPGQPGQPGQMQHFPAQHFAQAVYGSHLPAPGQGYRPAPPNYAHPAPYASAPGHPPIPVHAANGYNGPNGTSGPPAGYASAPMYGPTSQRPPQQHVLQPVPRPAALGLLAMINGNSGGR